MIIPNKITKFDRSQQELEELLLFAMACAGKNSDIQAQKLDQLLGGGSPFSTIRNMCKDNTLRDRMMDVGLGKYNLLGDGFGQVAHDTRLDLKRVDWVYLTRFSGVGLKTAKFYLCHSREDFVGAVLDTHMLNYLRGIYTKARVPKTAPSDPLKYKAVEALFLAECYRTESTPAELDLFVWNEMRKKGTK